MPEFVLPAEADHCPHCNRVLLVGKDCECGLCPAPREHLEEMEKQYAEAFPETIEMSAHVRRGLLHRLRCLWRTLRGCARSIGYSGGSEESYGIYKIGRRTSRSHRDRRRHRRKKGK